MITRFLCLVLVMTTLAARPPYYNPVEPFPPADAPAAPAAGTLLHRSVQSSTLGEEWGYIVYLPPSYAKEPKKKFPLIFWFHGAGGVETSVKNLNPISYYWNAMKDRRLPEAVIVAPSGLIRSYWHDDAWINESGVERAGIPIATAVMKDLLPHLEKTYRIRTDRNGRAATGFSMGGFGAMNLAITTGEFGACVSLDGNLGILGEESAGFKGSCQNDPTLLAKHNLFNLLDAHIDNAKRTRFYFSWGGESSGNGQRKMHAVMQRLGINHTSEDLSKEIPVHHAYRFLVPETGGNKIMEILSVTFSEPISDNVR